MRKAFADTDSTGAKSITSSDFRQTFEQLALTQKLASVGVNEDDVRDLICIVEDAVAAGDDAQAQVTVDEIIKGFVMLRDPHTCIVRGLRLLRQRFEQADASGHGSLDHQEVEEAFARPEVDEKLEHLQLDVPSWLTLFEELDTNGDGSLDWMEIQDGMTAFWHK